MKISVNHGWITGKCSSNFLATERYGDSLSINTILSVEICVQIHGHYGASQYPSLYFIVGPKRWCACQKANPQSGSVYQILYTYAISISDIIFFHQDVCRSSKTLRWKALSPARILIQWSPVTCIWMLGGEVCVITWTVESLEGYKEMWQQKKHGWEDMTSCVCFDMYVQICIHINIYIYTHIYICAIYSLYTCIYEYGWLKFLHRNHEWQQ